MIFKTETKNGYHRGKGHRDGEKTKSFCLLIQLTSNCVTYHFNTIKYLSIDKGGM